MFKSDMDEDCEAAWLDCLKETGLELNTIEAYAMRAAFIMGFKAGRQSVEED